MRFLFVDHIDKMDGNRISGRVRFPVDEPLQYVRVSSGNKVAAGAVSEALGQLASWLCIQRGGFQTRPVFLFADKIRVDKLVDPGTEVQMDCTVGEMDDKTFNFSGVATVNGEQVASIENCNGYFMPLDQMEDPAVTRSRYDALVNGGLQLAGRGGKPFPIPDLISEVVEREKGDHISVRCALNPDYPFYADHFPRFPVTPIVILNEMIGEAGRLMMAPREDQDLQVCEVSGIKIRNFVKPGEECVIKLQKMKSQELAPGLTAIVTVAEIIKSDKRILRGRYVFHLKGVTHA